MRIMLKSKIHCARVTNLNVDYEGSITIDQKLMKMADILPNEQVQVLNITNGARFTTYAIRAKKAGTIELNGAAARLAARGDTIIILTYSYVDEDKARGFTPTVIYVDEHNAMMNRK